MPKKVLIITYYWPPAGGPGVQRWLKFVKYLPAFDIIPIVYIPENPSYPIVDKRIAEEVPEGLQMIKAPIFEPYALASFLSKRKTKTISSGIITEDKQSLIERFMLFVRGNLFIPDARKFWIKPSVKYLRTFIENEQIGTVITTGPPHSLHLIGRALKTHLKVKWIADFRDPWTTIGYHNKLKLLPLAAGKHKQMEWHVLNEADHVTVTSPTTKKEFSLLTNQPITVLTNGFDDRDAHSITLDKKFTISHIGSLLSGRNPTSLWSAIGALLKEHDDFSSDFQLNLVGTVSDEVYRSIEAFGLVNHLNTVGYVSHELARTYQYQSQVLLLIEINASHTQCIIPGKLFEYMQTGRPIFAVGPAGADFKNIIRETKTGVSFNYEEQRLMKLKLLEYYNAYKSGRLEVAPKNLSNYHRKTLTKKMAAIIQNC